MSPWLFAAGGAGPVGPPEAMQVTTHALTMLGVYVGGALSVSFLCSIMEASLLSVRDGELLERSDAGDRGAARMLAIKRERIDDAISAILTLNTVAHTIGATLAGAQFAEITGNRWLGVFSGVLTLLVLVVTEIIPKTLGTVHASRLVGFVSRTLGLLIALLMPVLFVTRLLTRMISHGHDTRISRGELAALVAAASSDGTLDSRESRVVENILRFDQVAVADVMTPRTVAVLRPAGWTLQRLIDDAEAEVFSRIPIHGETQDDVDSYVLMREVLRRAAAGEGERLLSDLARELKVLPYSASLAQALRHFTQNPREPMALVVGEFGGVSGIVTLEDVIETILGVEIMDETDRVADLRKAATALRDQRLARVQTRVSHRVERAESEPE